MSTRGTECSFAGVLDRLVPTETPFSPHILTPERGGHLQGGGHLPAQVGILYEEARKVLRGQDADELDVGVPGAEIVAARHHLHLRLECCVLYLRKRHAAPRDGHNVFPGVNFFVQESFKV